MLSAADADLVQREKALAGMATVLDPDAFVKALRTARPDLIIADAQLSYIRYRPTRYCLGAYRIRTGNGVLLLGHITAYSAKAWTKLACSADEHHVVVRDETLISLFPGDTKLPSLAPLMNGDGRQTIMNTLLPGNAVDWSHDIETLAYKPERRYVGKIGNNGNFAILKHYRKSEYHNAALAAKAGGPSSGRLQIPRVLGQSERHQCQVIEWLPGRSLASEVNTAPEPGALYGVGEALAEFQTLPSEGLPERSGDMEIRKLHSMADTIALLHPPLASLARRLAGAIAEKLSRAPPAGCRLHGDFHPGQVILTDDRRAAFIDLDESARGHPLTDLGMFIAYLHDYQFRTPALSAQTAPLLIEALLEGYQNATQGKVTDSLRYYVAVGLFSLTHNPFRSHAPAWPEKTHAMLERIHDILHSPDLVSSRL